MKQWNFKKIGVVVAVVFIVGVGANAFAGWGRGFHGGYGPGWRQGGQGGYNCPGYGRTDISEEDLKKMDQEREVFFKDTETIRQQIYEKNLALRSELAKTDPDAGKAAEIQQALSDLQSQFDQKRLAHMIKMRKVNPNAGRNYSSGRGRMMGRGRGYMMGGSGARGGGYSGSGPCWQ